VAQVFNGADLTGGVPGTGTLQLVFRNATAIVGKTYQAQPTAAYLDTYLVRTGVKGILHQFFDDRYRTLDDFTCRDTFRNIGR